ncbi:transposase [Salmonella enterica subsp. enterica serovar Pensacola]|nr:transposase [Salmonella enterica]ECT8863829.1 transposase [Salmonella enterica subsp. enterica serovar Pensacola]
MFIQTARVKVVVASAGSDVRNYRPAVNRNIWDRVRLPAQNMPGVIVVSVCIKKSRKNKRTKGKTGFPRTEKEQRLSAKEPWLLFSSMDNFRPREIMKLYSRRMQIESNFRDEKSERFGTGLRASHSRSVRRMLVLSL